MDFDDLPDLMSVSKPSELRDRDIPNLMSVSKPLKLGDKDLPNFASVSDNSEPIRDSPPELQATSNAKGHSNITEICPKSGMIHSADQEGNSKQEKVLSNLDDPEQEDPDAMDTLDRDGTLYWLYKSAE